MTSILWSSVGFKDELSIHSSCVVLLQPHSFASEHLTLCQQRHSLPWNQQNTCVLIVKSAFSVGAHKHVYSWILILEPHNFGIWWWSLWLPEWCICISSTVAIDCNINFCLTQLLKFVSFLETTVFSLVKLFFKCSCEIGLEHIEHWLCDGQMSEVCPYRWRL